MPSSYTSSLRLTLPVQGELSGSWGNTVNTGITQLVDTSVAGTASITMTAANYTLSNNNGTTDEARAMFLVLGGTPGGSYQVICPAVSKLYFVTNNTGFAQTVKTSGGSGISVPTGTSMTLRCDGTNVVEALNASTSFTLSGALTVGGTTTLAANPTLSAGTANGVLYLNGSKVATSGSALTFDGTNFTTTGYAAGNGLRSLGGNTVRFYNAANANWSQISAPAGTGDMQFDTGAGEQMRITSTGLGIGTSSPVQKLTVQGGVNVTSSATLPAAQGSMLFSYESAVNRCYMGDGTGYSFAFSKRSASVTTDLMTLNDSGNLGIGTSSPGAKLDVYGGAAGTVTNVQVGNASTAFVVGVDSSNNAQIRTAQSVAILFYTAATERTRITSGGNWLVGTTANLGATNDRLQVDQTTGSARAAYFKNITSGTETAAVWNTDTAANNLFLQFYTEATATVRGSISYNRAGGLVAYNTTSDYRAKDIIGPVQNPGATIDALKVYEGVMKGATQSRPMLIAHEAQAHAPYAVSGVKDEVNEDGTPKLQQMDVSSLVPLLLAEIQSLRARVAALEKP